MQTHRNQKLWGQDLAARVITSDSDVAKVEKHWYKTQNSNRKFTSFLI